MRTVRLISGLVQNNAKKIIPTQIQTPKRLNTGFKSFVLCSALNRCTMQSSHV